MESGAASVLIVDHLFTVGPVSDALAWLVVGLFVAAGGIEWYGRRTGRGLADAARSVGVVAWVAFAAFWLNLVPFYFLEHESFVEGIGSLAAVPACLYVGLLLYRGRDSLFVLSRAVAAMGLIYLPFETLPAMTVAGLAIPEPRGLLIEHTARQTRRLMALLGYQPAFIESSEGYLATFEWIYGPEEQPIRISIVLACSGLGSMAIFGGLIAAVRGPVARKLRALAVSIPVIYVLNLLRTTFITVVAGNQYMHWAPDLVLFLFGASNPYRVSFLISDRIVSQLGAVVALIGVTYLVARQLPELVVVLEDMLYVLTGEEHDLEAALDLPRDPTPQPEVRADPTDLAD